MKLSVPAVGKFVMRRASCSVAREGLADAYDAREQGSMGATRRPRDTHTIEQDIVPGVVEAR